MIKNGTIDHGAVDRLAFAALATMLLASCSPYTYSQEISNFSAGVNSINSTYQTGQQSVGSITLQEQQAAYVADKARLQLLPGCFLSEPVGRPPKLKDCAIAPFPGTSVPVAPQLQSDLKSQQALAEAEPTFLALKNYADSLLAVTNAADSTALTQASQRLSTAVGTLVAAAAEVSAVPTPASEIVAPAANLFGLGVSLYLDSRRFEVLQKTVPAVDPAVDQLAATALKALRAIREVQLARLENEMIADAQPFETEDYHKLSQTDYQARLTALQAAVTTFRQARIGDPTATVNALITAHHQLATALQSDAGQTPVVMTAAENFLAAASQLRAAVDSATAVATKPKSARSTK